MTTILRQVIIATLLFSIPAVSSQSQSFYMSSSGNTAGDFSEEIYIRTDRDIYISGEKVYMKVFCLSRLSLQASGISRVAYINLLDRYNNPVISLKAGISGMSGTASFILPDTLGTGNYYIAGSTRWMQNFSPELYSYKSISVVNPFRNIDSIKIKSGTDKTDRLIFYPEGGTIIPGTANVIGFRCLDPDMQPVSFRGVISDSSDNILCHVLSDDNGFGIIRTEVPVDGKLYIRSVGEDAGRIISELPVTPDPAFSISVTDDAESNNYRVRINVSPGFTQVKRALSLRYAPVSSPSFLLSDDPLAKNENIVNRAALPAGLAFMYLADEEGGIITGRWLCNSSGRVMHIVVKPDRENYKAREKVVIEVYAEDSAGRPVSGDLLLSVVRRQSIKEPPELTGFGLQITGLPDENKNCGIYNNNDRLLFYQNDPAVHGNDDQKRDLLPEHDGHIISGTMMKTGTGEPMAGSDIVLSFVGSKALCKFATTDSTGRFMFVSTEKGIREMVIQPVDPDTNGYYVELDDPFPGTFSKNNPLELSIDTGILDMINKSVIAMQVKRIYDQASDMDTAAQLQVTGYDFYGRPEYSTDMSAFIQLTTLGEALKELVPGAFATTDQGRAVIKTVRKYNDMAEVGDPMVIVDGVPVPDHEKVLGIPGDKIANIKVLNHEYYISGFILGGVIDITTYRGDLSVIPFDKPLFRQEYHGLTGVSGFLSPDYSLPANKESRIPDFRNTLHWDPELKTDGNGRVVTDFFASDEPGEYLILVEGFSPDGKYGRGTANLIIETDGRARQLPDSMTAY